MPALSTQAAGHGSPDMGEPPWGFVGTPVQWAEPGGHGLVLDTCWLGGRPGLALGCMPSCLVALDPHPGGLRTFKN